MFSLRGRVEEKQREGLRVKPLCLELKFNPHPKSKTFRKQTRFKKLYNYNATNRYLILFLRRAKNETQQNSCSL